ncbi:hypothetical protein NECAME_13703 [Necator americanus]|uniref:Uncharacterized protein n=1 Tax=Necator americanus TaxID=51031 RepID=W2STC2_NECAM|nr:hypothetical protein NECAME_13703 [Necator americanus]ETN72865.1 hypothetical protein NECAME_13703 [Necator americanus]
MVDSGQFLRIASWREPSDSDTVTPTPSADTDIAGNMRTWYRNISRKKLFIIFVSLLVVLFIAAVIITVVLVLALQNHNKNEHEFTAIVFTVTSPSTPTAAPFRYVPGYVIGTKFRYVPLGTVNSLVPDIRGFTFMDQLLIWGDDTLSVIRNDTVSQGPLFLDTNNCTSCSLLAADEKCLRQMVPLRCDQSQAIYCCSGCPLVGNLCRMKGSLYQFSDLLVETRISAEGDMLLLTTASLINTTNCALQTHRVQNDGSIFSGSIQRCYGSGEVKSEQDPNFVKITTTTLSPDSAGSASVLTAVDSSGNVRLHNLTSDTTLEYIPTKIEGRVLSISTTIEGDDLMVALLQESRFYAIRLNLISGCVSLLENYYQNFLYSGQLRDFAWAGENLILWYTDRQGVNIVQFQFKWNSDSTC